AYLQTDLDRRIHHETVILYSVETGAPLIFFQDCAINENRTAAAGAVGAKWLARKNASRVAVFGSQVHAETQLKALAAVRKLTSARVFSPNADKTRIRQEIDEVTLRRAAPVFITSKTTVCANESDIFRAVKDGVISWEQVHEISDLLLGKVWGRTDERQITLFKLQG